MARRIDSIQESAVRAFFIPFFAAQGPDHYLPLEKQAATKRPNIA